MTLLVSKTLLYGPAGASSRGFDKPRRRLSVESRLPASVVAMFSSRERRILRLRAHRTMRITRARNAPRLIAPYVIRLVLISPMATELNWSALASSEDAEFSTEVEGSTESIADKVALVVELQESAGAHSNRRNNQTNKHKSQLQLRCCHEKKSQAPSDVQQS